MGESELTLSQLINLAPIKMRHEPKTIVRDVMDNQWPDFDGLIKFDDALFRVFAGEGAET